MSVARTVVVSHYAEDKGALLGDCLVPLALRIRAERGAMPCYLERHWLQGPHVRLVLSADVTEDVIAGDVVPRIAGYLASHSLTTSLVAEDYLHLSADLGRAELVSPPYGPLRPDNSVSVEEERAVSTTVLLGDAGHRLKQVYLTEAVRPLGFALDSVASGAHRAVLAFQALVASAARWPLGGIATGQLSYRSHLEDYLANNDPSGRVRARLEDQFGRNRDIFRKVFRAVVGDTDAEGRYQGTDPYLRAWSGVFDVVWPLALEAAARRDFEEDLGPGYLEQAKSFDAETERQWRFGGDRPSSEFHAQLARLNFLPNRVNVVPFAAYRFLTNNLTRWLPLLGVPPIERYFLSLAVSELTEEHFDVSWQTQFARIRERGSLAPGASA